MNTPLTRRSMLKTSAAAGALLGLGDLSFLTGVPPVSADEAKLDPASLRLDSGIEPLVRLLDDTPRDRLLEEVAARLRRGLSYRELLAALLLAGVRNVEPRPSVGHKFHSVLVVNSAHLASISSPAEHRWLPIFWALDYYKEAAARDVSERGDWKMGVVNEASVPPAHRARAAFVQAMDDWDESGADAAIAGLARTAGANEIYELLFRYGARDFRSIGHKAIYVANSWRTLQCIGWRHAEPVLRSLAYALLMHEGDNPARRDADADRPFRHNADRVGEIPAGWLHGKIDSGATLEMIQTLRRATPDEASDAVVKILQRGVAPQSVWDAMHLDAAELLMRQPGIVALHAVTSTNALYFAYLTSGQDETRRMLLLQNAAFLTLFRESMPERGGVKELNIDDLEPAGINLNPKEALHDIFTELSREPMSAAKKVLGFLNETGRADELIDAARVLVFLKGTNAHDYKFSSAVLEDYHHVSPAWRNRYMASNVFKLRGSQGRDNALVQRARAALG